jgi:hypothetical protein
MPGGFAGLDYRKNGGGMWPQCGATMRQMTNLGRQFPLRAWVLAWRGTALPLSPSPAGIADFSRSIGLFSLPEG